MNLATPYRIIKTFTIYYILIWINLLDGKPLSGGAENLKNRTDCVPEFETNLQQCIDGLYFYKWKTDAMKFQTSRNLFKEIFKRFFCRQYTNSLQCIHEILNSCNQNDTTQTVRKYLRQPWARQYNTLCDINQHNSTFLVRNNSSETLIGSRIQQPASNETNFALTESRQLHESSKSNIVTLTINSLPNSTSETKSETQSHKTIDSNINDNQSNSRKLGNRQKAEHTENVEKTLPKNTLFFSETVKMEIGFQNKKVNSEEYKVLLRKFEKMKTKILTQKPEAKDVKSYKENLDSKFEVQFEIH